MKKSKVFKSFLSILLSFLLLITVLTSGTVNTDESVNITINGVSGNFKKIGDDFLNLFDLKNENSQKQYKQKSLQNNNELVFIGGYPVGLKLYADGVVIVGTEAVDTENGNINPSENAGLKTGDLIKKINGKIVNKNTEVSEIIEKSNGEILKFTIKRNKEIFDVEFKSEFSVSEQKFKAGLWIRDSSAGIGTVTFLTQKGYFASLGHAVCDIDTKMTIPISKGECTKAQITGYIKGSQGLAGELCGYLENESTGEIFLNCDIGVYGVFDSLPSQQQLYPIASSDEIVKGEATILTTVTDGVVEEFKISVEQINDNSTDNKDLVIKVTDPVLIEKTGGIVQGMSGSPIIQNGKIIGAVTHVFLNDPTGGYGIFAETMLVKLNDLKTAEFSLAS